MRIWNASAPQSSNSPSVEMATARLVLAILKQKRSLVVEPLLFRASILMFLGPLRSIPAHPRISRLGVTPLPNEIAPDVRHRDLEPFEAAARSGSTTCVFAGRGVAHTTSDVGCWHRRRRDLGPHAKVQFRPATLLGHFPMRLVTPSQELGPH